MEGCAGSLLLPRGWHNSHMSYTAFLPYSKLPYSLAFQLSGQQESHFWLLLIQDEKKQRYRLRNKNQDHHGLFRCWGQWRGTHSGANTPSQAGSVHIQNTFQSGELEWNVFVLDFCTNQCNFARIVCNSELCVPTKQNVVECKLKVLNWMASELHFFR